MIKWERDFFSIATRNGAGPEQREGFVDESRTFALYLRGDLIEMTHVPSGKRIAAAMSLANADRMVEHLLGMDVNWQNPNIELSEMESVLIYSIVRRT